MRVRIILMAIVAAAAIAVFVWRPWADADPTPGEVAAATAPEQVPAAPPPLARAPVAAAPAAPPPADAPPQAAPARQLTLDRVPDSPVVPVLPTAENRSRLQALHKGVVGLGPAIVRLHAEFARAGRPLPPETKKLIEMRRKGASQAEQLDYVRSAFTDPTDRDLAVHWLATTPIPVPVPGAPAAPAPAGSPAPGNQTR
jgi:hypothetical protein